MRRRARRFPSSRGRGAIEFGADELIASLEWFLRNSPRSLRAVRNRYRKFCIAMLAQIERACTNDSGPDREAAA